MGKSRHKHHSEKKEKERLIRVHPNTIKKSRTDYGATNLTKKVKKLNSSLSKEGRNMLYVRVPEKIKEISEYIKVIIFFFCIKMNRTIDCLILVWKSYEKKFALTLPFVRRLHRLLSSISQTTRRS